MASQEPDGQPDSVRAANSRGRRVQGTGEATWTRPRARDVLASADGGPSTGQLPAVGQPLTTQPTQILQPDWITAAQIQAQAESSWTVTGADDVWVPGASEDDQEVEDAGGGASLVRPYARTGGRTKPVRHLDIEALVRTTVNGKEASSSTLLSPEHITIVDLCGGTVSVAEIAAKLAVPLGVARVIIADMVDLGLVEVMKTSAALGDERDPAFLRRVLSGLQRL